LRRSLVRGWAGWQNQGGLPPR